MSMDDAIYYVVYSPLTIRAQAMDFGWRMEDLPDYMRKGYYVSGMAFEPWNIKYKGTLGKCANVLRSINMFVYN